jgi:transposase
MSEIPLNKYEKEKRVIEMHLAGMTIRQIASEVHMSFTPISKIIKAYERKAKRQENNQSSKPKKQSKCSQAYALFLQGKKQVDVAIDLQLDFEKVRKYWKEFLRLKNMTKLYNIYIENEFHLDSLFRIYYFMLRNEIPIQDMENVLRIAYDTTKLYQTHSNLKAEIEQLKQIKNNYSLNQNTNSRPLLPLGLPEHYYRYYNY